MGDSIMSKLRLYGDTSGHVDLTVPAVAGATTIDTSTIVTHDGNGNLTTGNLTTATVTATDELLVGKAGIVQAYGPSIGYVASFQAATGNQSYISISTPQDATLGDTGMVIGVDTSAYRITGRESKSMRLATNGLDRFIIEPDGYRTEPYQPSFRYNGNTSQWINMSSAGTWYRCTGGTGENANGSGTLGVNLSTNNYGSKSSPHFNTSTGRFTAPTAGMYLFTFTAYITKDTANSNYLHINTEYNGSVQNDYTMWGYSPASSGYPDGAVCSWILNMQANDTFAPLIYNSGASQFRIYGDYVRISGHLLG